jgi:hypothetical protein
MAGGMITKNGIVKRPDDELNSRVVWEKWEGDYDDRRACAETERQDL